ncbi:hypothetical protein HC931_19415 [Candidatus Gracilibacteria bacterium]|nr:hypothetical protein [Candidatus Gracilibacteria bacterium]NJM87258.1 hypothetical protein [Hydrococcus sp. RU_2_2]NJP18627.1 hypothetical protein [Hydrococcus sp. CRU_1_1]
MDNQAPETEVTSAKVDKKQPTEHDIVVASDRAESSINEQINESLKEESDSHAYADYETENSDADGSTDK